MVQLQWLNDEDFARLLALTQFLPGPASSQLGFAIGRLRGGVAGAFVAFIGFTLPSFLLMGLLALYANALPLWLQGGVISGLKWLAVVVVADAVWNMGRRFCTHKLTRCLAMVVALLLIGWPTLYGQVIALLLAAIVGWRWLRPVLAGPAVGKPVLRRRPLVLFGLLVVAALLTDGPLLALWNDFFTAGALVFGGGHVVLPLLQELVGSRLSPDAFLTGYAAAQAVPGPMFSFASYLGATLRPDMAVGGAIIATLAVFLPGFLLLTGVSGVWRQLAQHGRVVAAIAGVNAVAVGMLVAAWVNPVLSNAPRDPVSILLAIGGLFVLRSKKMPIIWIIAIFSVYGAVRFVAYFPSGLLGA